MNGEATEPLAGREVLSRTEGDRVPAPRRDPDSPPAPSSTSSRHRPPDSVRWIWGTAFALFVLYTVAGVRDHTQLGTLGYDLGIFEQDVRSWAGLHLPTAELLGPDYPRLGNHFSPILLLLAPFYVLFSSPVTLIVAQAALLAVAVVPIATWAQRTLDRNTAVVVALGYGLSWGLAHAVEFSFHEVAFAVPLLAFSACALGQGRARAAVAWALPLLLVKEDLGLTVIGVGLLVWLHLGRRVLGLCTIGIGFVGMGLAYLILNLNRPGGGYDHSGKVGFGEGNFGSQVEHFTVGMLNPESKAQLLILLFAITGFLALRSPLALLAVPTLAWRLYSDHWPYFTGHYHYNLVLMPILFAAFVHAMVRLGPDGAALRRFALQMCAVTTALLLPSSFLANPLRPSAWAEQPRVAQAKAVMAQLPDDATVATSNNLAPQLTGRAKVSIFGWTHQLSDPDWILVDRAAWPWPYGSWDKQEAALAAARTAGFRDVDARGDFVLLHRTPAATATVDPAPLEPAVQAPATPRIERPAGR